MAPRGRQHSSGGGTGSSTAASASAIHVLNTIVNKRSNYEEGINKNHLFSKQTAERLSIGGELEMAFSNAMDEDNPSAKDEIQQFLQEHRQRLKLLSEKNVQAVREVDVFILSLDDLREVVQQSQQSLEDEEAGIADLPNYEESLRKAMDEHRRNKLATALDLRDEPFCREIRTRLGEKEAPQKRKKSGKHSGKVEDDEDDDDDDLEVINMVSSQNLKCPMTGMLFDDPVKNKLCGHVYSRAGIEQLFQANGSKACPVPGCVNSRVTREQLDDDVEMAMKVRRFKRKEDFEKQHRMSQMAMDDDDSDEEF